MPDLNRSDDHLSPLALEMVGDEGEDGVVAGLVLGLVADNDNGEVFLRREPRDGVPHGVAAGMIEGAATCPRLAIFDNRYSLVVNHQVRGKTAHDARLVAAMTRQGLTNQLTFNKPDFTRFAEIRVFTPGDVPDGRIPASA